MIRNIHFEIESTLRLPREVQLRRMKKVIDRELTPIQRDTINAYYFRGMTIPAIAAERGVHKSTVSRTLRRAEATIRRCLRY